MTTPLWIEQFDASYAVPEQITGLLKDRSWHNDVSPSFEVDTPNGTLILWVEHPDIDRRESGGPRYAILGEWGDFDVPVYEGDDLDAVMAAIFPPCEVVAAESRCNNQPAFVVPCHLPVGHVGPCAHDETRWTSERGPR